MSEISNALFVDLTKPEATKEFAVTDLSKKLIEWVGLDVIRFRRNQQVAHRIVDHGRETYDQINGVIDTIDEDPGEETDYDKFTKYTDAVEDHLFKFVTTSETKVPHHIAKTDMPQLAILPRSIRTCAGQSMATHWLIQPLKLIMPSIRNAVQDLIRETMEAIDTLGVVIDHDTESKEERKTLSIQFLFLLRGVMDIVVGTSDLNWQAHLKSREVWMAAKFVAEHLNLDNKPHDKWANWTDTYDSFIKTISNLPSTQVPMTTSYRIPAEDDLPSNHPVVTAEIKKPCILLKSADERADAQATLRDTVANDKERIQMMNDHNDKVTTAEGPFVVRLSNLFRSIFKRLSRVKHTYRAQVVEAVRISYELAGSATDHAKLCTTLAALEDAIEGAVNAEGRKTMDIFHKFVNCLNDESKSKRMEDAKNKDQQNATKAAMQSMRLEGVLKRVKKSPILCSKHIFVIAEPRIDMTMEIPYDAKLPDILWKFHRLCGKDIHIKNPHFYSDTAFKQEGIRDIRPLGDRNAEGDGRWTERIFVIGGSKEGLIKLTSQDGTIERLFGVVTQYLTRPVPLTVFKDIEGRLLPEEEVDLVFSGARDLKCFRWRDSSFVIDPAVRKVQDVVKFSMTAHRMTAKLNRDADSVARRELNVYHLERACSGYLFLRLVAGVIDRWQRTFPARNVQAFRSVFLVKDGLLDKLPPLRTAQVVVWDADAMVKVRFEKARGIWFRILF